MPTEKQIIAYLNGELRNHNKLAKDAQKLLTKQPQYSNIYAGNAAAHMAAVVALEGAVKFIKGEDASPKPE